MAGFAKELIHNVKLRVLCASRANTASRKNVSASKMADMLVANEDGELDVSSDIVARADQNHAVDVVVGTPAKVLELMRGRGWDHDAEEERAEKSSSSQLTPRRRLKDSGDALASRSGSRFGRTKNSSLGEELISSTR